MDFNLEAQRETLADLAAEFRGEYDRFPRNRASAPPKGFYLENGMYGSVDAEILWAMVRYIQPRRIIEVGSGWTTALMSRALDVNGGESDIISIDPVPPGAAYGHSRVTLHARHLHEVGDVFGGLTEDDMIIVDGSHVWREDGEIDLVLRVLPGLSGVYVQFHDIFLPGDYPEQWADRGYDEQEHLAAYLEEHPDDKVVLAAAFLHRFSPETLAETIGSYDPARAIPPGAFWFRTSVKHEARSRKAKAAKPEPEPEPEEPELAIASSETMAALL